MLNPYWNAHFFEVFAIFFQRLFTGQIFKPATDEVQIGVLCLVALATALIGTFLVLRKMTMLANALSHTILLGIVAAFFLAFLAGGELTLARLDMKLLLLAAVITALITAFCTQWLTRVARLYSDASIGFVFSTFFALGVVLVTLLTRNMHLGIEAVMGNVDALHVNDLKLIAWIAAIDLTVVVLFFKEWHLTTFDHGLARVLGFSPTLMGYVLMGLSAFTLVGAFRSVGVILVLGLMIFPPMTARLFVTRLKSLLLAACAIGIVNAFIAVALSRHMLSAYGLPLSTSGLLTACLCLSYVVAIGTKKTLRKPKGFYPLCD